MKKKNIWTIILIAIFVIPIIYILISDIYIDEQLRTNYVYRIARVKGIEYISKNNNNWLIFEYNKKSKGKIYISNDSTDIYTHKIDKRFIVKMSEEDWINNMFYTYKIYFNIPVPDSVKSAPLEGWKELPEWAKNK